MIYADGIFELFYYAEEIADVGDYLFNLGCDMAIVYINIYVLIPKYLVERKYTTYLILTFISILTVILTIYTHDIASLSAADLEEIDILGYIIQISFYTIGTLGIAAAIKITKYFYERQQHLNELKQSQLSSEVNYLKQQTNPHFLFNTLNSIYVLAKQKKENTPTAIMLLSDLMRYQTYDASSEKVPLTKEIEFLKNYLELEKLRRDKLNVEFNIEGNVNGEIIEPLLFLPFIENAVKHSASTDEQQENISITLQNHEKSLILNVGNSVGTNTLNSIQKENSGFGLDNAIKRIGLLYPDSHTLNVSESENSYKVKFSIDK